jgi:hypothetical protein
MTLLNAADEIHLGSAEVDLVYLDATEVWAPATAPKSSLIISYTPGSDRNDFTGEVGVRIGIGAAAMPVSWMGVRVHHASNTGLRTLKLYEWFSQAVQRTAIIDITGKPVGSYVWAPITPITLAANGYYALLMPTFAGDGQIWANPGPVMMVPSIVNIYDSYYDNGLQTGMQNNMFNGVDLGA